MANIKPDPVEKPGFFCGFCGGLVVDLPRVYACYGTCRVSLPVKIPGHTFTYDEARNFFESLSTRWLPVTGKSGKPRKIRLFLLDGKLVYHWRYVDRFNLNVDLRVVK